MAKDKKKVIIYSDWIHTVEKLSDEDAGKLVKHLFRYINDQNPEPENFIVDLAFESWKQQLKRDLKGWEEARENYSKNGQLGNIKRYYPEVYDKVKSGLIDLETAVKIIEELKNSPPDSPPTAPRQPPIAKLAVNDNVTVKVNDINKRKENKRKIAFEECLPSQEFEKDFKEFLDYWFEHGTNDKKMKFEKQKSFDWSRRWGTWIKNKTKWEDERKKVAPKKESAHEILMRRYNIENI